MKDTKKALHKMSKTTKETTKTYSLTVGEVFTQEKANELIEYLKTRDEECNCFCHIETD